MKKLAATLFALTALWNVALAAAPSVEVVEETDEYRLIRHAAGETQVPINPKRVVATYYTLADAMLALELSPIAAAIYQETLPTYLADRLANVASVGGEGGLNLEAVLSVQPDLILAGEFEGELYDQLSQIAPTVIVTGLDGNDFRRVFRDVATVLNLSKQAEVRLEQYDRKVAEVKAQLAQALGEMPRVAFLRVTAKENRLYQPLSPAGNLLYNELGLELPALTPTMTSRTDWWGPVSTEVIPELGADYILLVNESDTQLQQLEQLPLWSNLPAVQAGRVYPVELAHWLRGSLLGRERAMVDVLEALTDTKPAGE